MPPGTHVRDKDAIVASMAFAVKQQRIIRRKVRRYGRHD